MLSALMICLTELNGRIEDWKSQSLVRYSLDIVGAGGEKHRKFRKLMVFLIFQGFLNLE